MLDHDEFDRWRQAAADARRSVRLQGDADLHNWACFLAEQAGQLGVKGLLRGMGSSAWGHDLVELGQALGEELDEPLEDDLKAALQRLSRHYIPARYPDAHRSGSPGGHYGPQDTRQASADADLLLEFVDSTWAALVARSGRDDGG